MPQADLRAEPPRVTVPAERGGLLDRDARFDVGGEHRLLIRAVLALENIPRGHRHDARGDPLTLQLLVHVDAKR